MSHFYGSMKGSRGEVARMGTKSSGITAHVRGWHIGGSLTVETDGQGRDVVTFYLTGGSANPGSLGSMSSSRVRFALNPDGTIERL